MAIYETTTAAVKTMACRIAAEVLEENDPQIARGIKILLDLGETPEGIGEILRERLAERDDIELVADIIESAAAHYQTQMQSNE